ncbi:uncharacterized protein PRD47_008640 [Ara ararauna]
MGGNHTQIEFVLLGITDRPYAQTPLFVLFLLIYIVTLVGNVGIILLVQVSPSLHTPMYFFLTHFAFIDICYSTVISPRMLADLLSEDKTISFTACMMQFLMFAFFATLECHLLAMMAYDRHVAICHPLLYVTIISSRVCWQLVASSYLFAFLSAIICTWCIYGGSFCGPNRIDHFFCDIVPVLKLVCSDTHSSEVVIFAFITINVVGTSVITVFSYISVLFTVLRMCSAQSRARAFHTCASHLMSVALLYGSAFFMYLQPPSNHKSLDKVASIFYAVLNPVLNPFIYSLRNKEVKEALVKCGRRFFNHHLVMGGNHTQSKFILLGITNSPYAQTPLFVLFLLIYIVTLVENVGIIILMRVAPSLHTPMYFFLTHFAFTEVCYSTVVSPRMLADLLSEDKTISFTACMMQFLTFIFFGSAECHLLAMMAYDRHVAICHPLLYVTTISSRVCWQLVTSSYLFAFLTAVICTWCMFGGPFCGPKHIDHFFCDIVPVLKLICPNTYSSEMVIFAFITINVVGTSVVILLSYISILRTMLRMCSTQSRARAFHTCASHLMAVSLFFGTAFFMYLQPPASHRSLDKVASIFYSMVTPMLNPFIYSLRNREVKGALVKCGRRLLSRWQHKRVVSSRTRSSS